MAAAGGLKHVSTEPAPLANKRERRRGASGRAAVLRRAPSDSDCSGETASLSADSGERRPLPPKPGKTRSRRRGSEWEVLEGLKDGQRFDRRPEVFNGYLHKKRKWPLKGWHKRFFVVDGGILVYARSPTDVARGRLHGSVDVGLSVISAKARRRRIDIDADEFIYHLRAKTADVFRTWLNVLKVHRLYRQHLLTFGAREATPKVVEDLPLPLSPSSHTESVFSLSSDTESIIVRLHDYSMLPGLSKSPVSITDTFSFCSAAKQLAYDWCETTSSNNKLMPLNFEPFEDIGALNKPSPCSLTCVTKKVNKQYEKLKNKEYSNINGKQLCDAELNYPKRDSRKICLGPVTKKKESKKSNNIRSASSEHKTHIRNAGFDLSPSKTTSYIHSRFLYQCSMKTPSIDNNKTSRKISPMSKSSKKSSNFKSCSKNKIATPLCYLTTTTNYKKMHDTAIRRSKKCTNLKLYQNLISEPKLIKPISMILGHCQCKQNVSNACSGPFKSSVRAIRSVVCLVQPESEKEDKWVQDCITIAEYDKISSDLMMTVLKNFKGRGSGNENEFKQYIKGIIKELYNENDAVGTNVMKLLFRSLLQYWLKNTEFEDLHEILTKDMSLNNPSNKCFTQDKNLSSVMISNIDEETQHDKHVEHIEESTQSIDIAPILDKNSPLVVPDRHSFDQGIYLQKLESVLKNTHKKKDKEIANENNNGSCNLSTNSDSNTSIDEKKVSHSSIGYPEMEDTLTYIINEKCSSDNLPKDFFGAYIDVVVTNSSNYCNETIANPRRDSKEALIANTEREITPQIFNNRNETTSLKQTYLTNVFNTEYLIFTEPAKDNTRLENTNENLSADYNHLFQNKIPHVNTNPVDIQTCETKVNERPENLVNENSKDDLAVPHLSECNLKHISTRENVVPIAGDAIKNQPKICESRLSSLSPKFNSTTPTYFGTGIDNQSQDLSYTSCSTIKTSTNAEIEPNSEATSKGFGRFLQNDDNFSSTTFKNIHNSYKFFEPLNKDASDDDCIPCNTMPSLHINPESALQFKCDTEYLREKDSKTKQTSSDRVFTAADKQALGLYADTEPQMINEQFILLLLENVTLMAKSVPAFYKDIRALYLKLRKTYDKENQKIIQDSSLTSSMNAKEQNLSHKTNNESVSGSSIYTQKYDYPKNNTEKCSEDNMTVFKEVLETEDVKSKHHFQIVSAKGNKFEIDKDTAPISDKDVHVSGKVLDESSSLVDKETDLKSFSTSFLGRDRELAPVKSGSDKESSLTYHRYVPVNFVERLVLPRREVKAQSEPTASSGRERDQCAKREYAVTARPYLTDRQSNTKVTFGEKGPYISSLRLTKTPRKKSTMHGLIHAVIQSSSLNVATKATQNEAPLRNDAYQFCKKKRYLRLLHLFHGKPWVESASDTSRCSILNSYQNFKAIRNDLKTINRNSSNPSYPSESGGSLETVSRELGQAQLSIQQLQRLLDALEVHQPHHDTDVSLEGASPNVKKDRRKFGLRKKKSSSKCSSIELAPTLHIDASSSHSTLSTLTAPPSPGSGASSMPTSATSLPMACGAARPQSLPAEALAPAAPLSLTPDHLREDFTVLAKDLVHSLNGVVSTLVCERGRLRAAMDASESAAPQGAMVTALRTNLNTALQQNSELRSRLSRIHDASDIGDVTAVHHDPASRPFHQSLSFSSSCVSASEFFDAEEHEEDVKTAEILPVDEAGVIELDGDSSSEAGSLTSHGSEASASSENSDPAMLSAESRAGQNGNGALSSWSRRTRLPSPRPTPGGPSLWNLLYKNIGKDLSQISMPVTINEPLNMLQRLCEELEYSELLDSAAQCASGVERMALIAAFAVSAYAAAAHRAASKPFNPLLAETYECVRDDRSFRFISEQVSHHPPVSACHADSPAWSFWQEARIKTKFWGKSMEFQPAGRVHVRLNTTGDHYSWNKVTTCVHNLFGGQRWVDQYGEMTIVCHGTQISCKLNFVKASSWSSSRHEVRGAVTDGSTGARLRLQGRWSEALYAGEPPAARCLWRPGAMPPEHEQYYGFTRFAMELNELEPGLRRLLPPTDTRLRPDQRALEEGDVEVAEQYKLQLEQSQRERRRDGLEHAPQWFRKSVSDGEEMWVFAGEYWKAREAGYVGHNLPSIW